MGAPGDAAFQTRVLMAILALFDAKSGPVLADFPENAPALESTMEGWFCPIDLSGPGKGDVTQAMLDEITMLRPWYDRFVEPQGGRSTVGAGGIDLETTVAMIAAYLRNEEPPAPPEGIAPYHALKLAVENFKAFYLEAAQAQPGASSARLADWFWGETKGGNALLVLREQFKASGDDDKVAFGRSRIVPQIESHRTPNT
jgi:hypothetical protein